MNLQQIISRRVDPLKPAVVTVGSFNSGDAYNIIPDTAKIKGTVRTFDEDVRDLIEMSIGQIAKSTCEGAGAAVKYSYDRGYPAVWNHPNETRKVEEQAKLLIGEEHVKKMKPHMGMEDFAYYLQKVPGTFFWVGGKNPEKDAIYPHHHPRFDVDEQSMLIIGKMFLSILLAKTTNIN
jgi:amidohydrolase